MEYVIELYRQLEQQLDKLETEASGDLELIKHCYRATEEAMVQLKTFISSYTFKNVTEEIYFFKELKPKFYSRLIYYVKLFEIETNKPVGAIQAQRKYLSKLLTGINRFNQEHISFYKYYRSGAVHMDAAYFTRDKFDIHIGFDISYFDCDQSFCTNHDYTVATLLANERLTDYLEKKRSRLKSEASNSRSAMDIGLMWAETKSAFVELMYGLQSRGAFYNSKTNSRADIKEIAQFFEMAFGMDLGNYYRTFQEIRIRKKGRTAFIDKMKDDLIRRMDDSDENPR